MRLLDRYLLRELLAPLGLCLGGILIFYVAFDLIGGLNRYQEHHLNAGDVADIYVAKVPEMLVLILPIVLLLALQYSLTNLSRHHELVAMRAAGVSLWRLSMPYLAVGLLCSVFVLYLNEEWVPQSRARQAEIMARHQPGGASAQTELRHNFFFPSYHDSRKWQAAIFDVKSGVLRNPVVTWKENGRSWTLIAHRAEYNDGIWIFYGTNTLATNDIASLPQLAQELQKPESNIAEYVKTNLSPETTARLALYSGGEDAELRKLLAGDLNHFLLNGPLYDTHRFYGVKLGADAVDLLARNAAGTDLLELNFLLLADAFPSLSCRKSAYSVKVLRDKTGAGLEEFPVLYTNRLAMPRFTESLEDLVSEAHFNDRWLGLNPTETVEVPIRELYVYLRAHPLLNDKLQSRLATQLHERIAKPLTCLVVVLISVPLGAVGGRRNIFVGVAGSIILVLAYMALFQVSLVFGTGWLAAWIPNVVFGSLGCYLISRMG